MIENLIHKIFLADAVDKFSYYAENRQIVNLFTEQEVIDYFQEYEYISINTVTQLTCLANLVQNRIYKSGKDNSVYIDQILTDELKPAIHISSQYNKTVSGEYFFNLVRISIFGLDEGNLTKQILYRCFDVLMPRIARGYRRPYRGIDLDLGFKSYAISVTECSQPAKNNGILLCEVEALTI
jgi:hypothetical protein